MSLTRPMRFEAFVVDDETFAKELYFRPPNEEDVCFHENGDDKKVYSVMLERVLDFYSYRIARDETSTLYIFELQHDHQDHQDIFLIIELFNLEMQIV